MVNLLVEYNRRNKLNSIPVCHNGVCFFESGSKPALIALTSLCCRPFSTCHECPNNENPIIELFAPGAHGSFYVVDHAHVHPNADLMEHVNKYWRTNSYSKINPFYAKTEVDLDVWLWKFITSTQLLKVFKSLETDSELKKVEQIAWAAFKQPALYTNYYMAYEALLLNRKYMLFGGDE